MSNPDFIPTWSDSSTTNALKIYNLAKVGMAAANSNLPAETPAFTHEALYEVIAQMAYQLAEDVEGHDTPSTAKAGTADS